MANETSRQIFPEFREIRKNNPNFINLCLTQNYQRNNSQPIKRFGFDAAIIFSDILMIPYGLVKKLSLKKLWTNLEDLDR